MGLATLDDLTFRISPSEIQWNWKLNVNIEETLGGRVVQIVGATMSDVVISGLYGEDHSRSGGEQAPGRSWKMADNFVKSIYNLMQKQTPPFKALTGYFPGRTLRFTYFTQGDPGSAKGYHDYQFDCYIKSLVDSGGAAVIEHKTGKFSYGYTLTLIPIVDYTTKLVDDDGDLKIAKNKAVEAALDRIANGLGWRETRFNDPTLSVNNADGLGDITDGNDYISDLREAIKKQGGITGITPQDEGSGGSSGDDGHSGGSGGTTTPVITKGAVTPPLGNPVNYGQAFGWPSGHPGIDIDQPCASPIYAVADGTVLDAGPARGFGKWVVIYHEKLKVCSVYGHMYDDGVFVKTGDEVKKGKHIADEGSAGDSSGCHLHFEVWATDSLEGQNNKIDPEKWLRDQGVSLPPLGSVGQNWDISDSKDEDDD